MKKVKINVVFNTYSRKYYVTANRGKFNICSFTVSHHDGVWYFSPYVGPSRIPITVGENGGFPVDYLLSLCKSIWFLYFGVGELPEIELTQASKKLLGIKQ